MSLAEGRGALTKSFKDLSNRWMEVRTSWNDSQADYFEKQYLYLLETEVRKALAAMDHMNVVLQKIVKDCE